jgi:rhamnose transport system permease protein
VRRGRTIRPERVKELTLLLLIIVAIVVFSFLIDSYISGRFFNRVTQSVAVVAVIAAGQSLVIITRNIDLSVGSIAGVSAYLTGDVLGDHLATSPVVAVLLAMAIGTLLGLVNGALVAYGRIPSIIVTLGTLAIYRTWLISYAEARTITAASLPQWLVDLPRSTVFAIGDFEFRTMFVLAIVVIAVLQVVLARLRAGRIVYAIGSNPEAARQSGLPVQRTTLAAFTACGALAGLGGFLVLARFGTITVSAGQGLELQSIAAAVVGGVSTLGGSGTIVGSFFGAVLIGLLDQSIVRVPQISEFVRDAVLGLLILLAVVLDGLLSRRFVHRRTIMAAADQTTTGPPSPDRELAAEQPAAISAGGPS